RQVRARRLDACLIVRLPASLAAIERRLRGRGSRESEEEIARRLAIARRELACAPLFDAFVVNDRLEAAVEGVLEVMAAARAGRLDALADRTSLAAVRTRLDPALAAWLPG